MNASQPFARRQADGIARAFLPMRWWGNRYDYYYTREKLASDPLYPGVLQALRGTDAPLLDLGCGLGLLAHALARDGQALAYYGVDNDAPKIERAIARIDWMRTAAEISRHVRAMDAVPGAWTISAKPPKATMPIIACGPWSWMNFAAAALS